MKNHLYLLLAAMLLAQTTYGQVTNNIELSTSINDFGANPDPSAKLHVQSTDKGILIPRMTTAQRTNINSPATGLLVFDTTNGSFWFYNGTAWADLSAGGGGGHWAEDTFNGGINYNDRIAVNHVETNPDAKLYVLSNETGDGKSGIHSRRLSNYNAADGGSSWAEGDVDTAIKGYTQTGNSHSTGIYGASYLDFNNSASVVGAHAGGATYGALGYKDASGNIHAGYFQGNVQTNGNHAVTGTSNLSGDLNLAGDGHVTGDFNMDSDANVAGSLQVTNGISTDANLTVDGASNLNNGANVTGNLDVSGASNLNNGANVTGNLAVSGASNLNNGANVTGNLTLDDGTQAAGRVLTSDANGNASWQAAPADGHWIDDPNGIHKLNGNVAINATTSQINDELLIGHDNRGGNRSGIHVYSLQNNSQNSGADWSVYGVDAGIKSYDEVGYPYSATVFGVSNLFYNNSAAILGSFWNGNTFGALGYKDDLGDLYAGYFNGAVRINDGTQAAGRVLTSDALGNASWQNSNWLTNADGIYHNTSNVAINSTPNANYNLYVEGTSSGSVEQASIYAYRGGTSNGISWAPSQTQSSVKAYSDIGNNYNAAIYGSSLLANDNTAAVVGATIDGSIFGTLAYNYDGSIFAGYFDGRVRIKDRYGWNGLSIESPNNSNWWSVGVTPTGDHFGFKYNNNITASIDNSDGSYSQFSDRSLKTDIEYLGGILPKITQLKPAKYYYKSSMDAPQKSHGFIAQEVQEVFPELVYEREGLLTLAYDNFAVLSIQAIKEQQVIIDSQNAKIESQGQKNAELEKQVANQNTKIENLQNQLNEIKAMLSSDK